MVVIKQRKQAQEVNGAVDWGIGHHYDIVRYFAALNMQTAGHVAVGAYAGQRLQKTCGISVAEQFRVRLHEFGVDTDAAGHGAADGRQVAVLGEGDLIKKDVY